MWGTDATQVWTRQDGMAFDQTILDESAEPVPEFEFDQTVSW